MKIFLSWSGKQSLELAKALREWLPDVFQAVTPFLSEEDIEAGERWLERLNTVLDDHDFGVVCLTRSNLKAPYVMFESGALAKRLGKAKLIPVLCDLSESDLIKHPLQQFQYVHLDQEGINKLAFSINANLGDRALSTEKLKAAFAKWWPDLEKKIEAVRGMREGPQKEPFSLEPAIEEILATLRTMERKIARSYIPSLGNIGLHRRGTNSLTTRALDPAAGLVGSSIADSGQEASPLVQELARQLLAGVEASVAPSAPKDDKKE